MWTQWRTNATALFRDKIVIDGVALVRLCRMHAILRRLRYLMPNLSGERRTLLDVINSVWP